MIRSLKALSVLLRYPCAELKEMPGEIAHVLADETVFSPAAQSLLQPLLQDIASLDLYALQERYVLLFDRSRSLSLNLFEHVHGESRDRGPAMVDLLETYRKGGFDLCSTELPDHLPILLEFLATRPLSEAKEILNDAGAILAALAERLNRRESGYAPILEMLAELAGVAQTATPVQELLKVKDDDPTDLASLDAVWQEAEVTFGPDPNAGCLATRDMMAKFDPPPNITATNEQP